MILARLALALRNKSEFTAKVPLGQSSAGRPIGTPAGKLRKESPKPGRARMQAVWLSPEKCIVVDSRIILRKQEKADAIHPAEGSSPGYDMASLSDTTGV